MVAGAPKLQRDTEAEDENRANNEADERYFHGVFGTGRPKGDSP